MCVAQSGFLRKQGCSWSFSTLLLLHSALRKICVAAKLRSPANRG